MKQTIIALALGASAFIHLPAVAQGAPDVSLTRFDCGTGQAPTEVNQRFSDTFAFGELKVQFVFSCYLIKHNDEYMIWDTGQPMNSAPVAPKVSLVDQLAKLNLKPDQIKYVGISHFHGDHTGQVASFPKATLFIGKGDWDVLTSAKPPAGVNPEPFANWIKGGGNVESLPNDKDVFGDGSVIVLSTPGHTPGHHSLLVKLAQSGSVILSGDFAHFHENYNSNGVPWFNHDRAQTLASIDRVKRLAMNQRATVILQHDARDINLLPAFPNAAK
ncbi:MAG: fold metallo-hydrolase [Betaproteobacteria bacterium]|nr:fold metallo-hydrolase [Betaproteobacteria bacterium]